MIDILVISHACFKAVNRSVYRELARSGYQIELVIPKSLNYPSGRLNCDPEREDDPKLTMLDLKGSNPRTYTYQGIEEVLDKVKPKYVLLDNDPISRMSLIIGQLIRNKATKLVCLSCENLPLDIKSEIKRRGWKYLPISILKRLTLKKVKSTIETVLTINDDGTKIFESEGFNRVIKTPLGFDPRYFSIDDSVRHQLRHDLVQDKDVNLIAYFGRLTPAKGVHILIQALGLLKNDNWLLMMDKFDEYSSNYELKIKALIKSHSLMDKVVFVSPNHVEIGGYMNAADLVIVPSISTPNWKEQYGRVIPEAMACGKTIIASKSGAIPELIGKFGCLIEENNSELLAKKIDSWINGEKLVDYSALEISQYALTNFSLASQVKILSKIFV